MEVYMKVKILIMALILILLSGCAVTLTDFNKLKERVDQLEKAEKDSKPVAANDQQLNEELKALSKQNQHIFSQLQAINNRLTSLENRNQENAAKPPVEKATAVVENNTPAVDTVTATPVNAGNNEIVNETTNSTEEIYNEGRRLYGNKDYPAAIKMFSMITDNQANHELAGPAQYWIAECFYSLCDYSASKIEFQKIVKGYPSSSKFIDAQVKIALCMINLNQKAKAKQELLRIKKEYPKYERKALIDDWLKKI